MLAAIAGRVKAALTDQILIRKGKIWIERLKIGPAVIFQASAPRIFNAAVLAVVIASAAVEVFLAVVIASVVAADSAAIVLVAVAADLADSAAEVSEADVDNDQLN